MKVVHVAVGVIKRGDEIFLSKRAEHLHQGGFWEFPGGKVEMGETVEDALYRELQEELNIQINKQSMVPLTVVEHDYGDKQVRLDTWIVEHFDGQPIGNEGQECAWVNVNNLHHYEFPEANKTIIDEIRKQLL